MKKYITQNEFQNLNRTLINKLDGHKFDFILGIRNGGLNVSTPVAAQFNMPHHSIRISFYDQEQRLLKPIIDDWDKIEFLKSKKNFLWVDDIIDSGSTLRWFIENTGLKLNKDFKVATLHWCKENSPDLEPTFYVEIKVETTLEKFIQFK